jgi:hypothetical protein
MFMSEMSETLQSILIAAAGLFTSSGDGIRFLPYSSTYWPSLLNRRSIQS